jgi:hypothetical protein
MATGRRYGTSTARPTNCRASNASCAATASRRGKTRATQRVASGAAVPAIAAAHVIAHDDTLPGGDSRCARAQRAHRAGNAVAHDERQLDADRAAAPQHHLIQIDVDRADADQRFARRGLRRGTASHFRFSGPPNALNTTACIRLLLDQGELHFSTARAVRGLEMSGPPHLAEAAAQYTFAVSRIIPKEPT